MKITKSKLIFILIAASLFSMKIMAQDTQCKVLMPSISGTYTGECKKGLAQGKGISQGIDRYEGQFIKGLPQGKGTYTWADGSVYTGEWQKGVRDGEGEMMHSGGTTEKGYWKGDKYVGKELVRPYVIVRKDNLLSCSFRRTGDGNDVLIKVMMKGQINTGLSSLVVSSTNGSQYKSGFHTGIQNVYFPIDVKVTYTTNNPVSLSSFDVVFECTINEPGKWEVTLNN